MSGSEKSVCSIFTKRRKFWSRCNKIPSWVGRSFLFNITQKGKPIKEGEDLRNCRLPSADFRLSRCEHPALYPADPLTKSNFSRDHHGRNSQNVKKNAIDSDGMRLLWNCWKSYLIPAPLSKSAFTVSTASFPVLSLAARSIPFDSCPISFAGCRLVTMTIILPTKSSGL